MADMQYQQNIPQQFQNQQMNPMNQQQQQQQQGQQQQFYPRNFQMNQQNYVNKKYKTQLCRHFSNGNCQLGNSCQFAHGQQELNQSSGGGGGQNQMGQLFPSQSAPIGGGGNFSQGANKPNNNFKTQPCRFFANSGQCKNGENCKFAHGEGELQPSMSSNQGGTGGGGFKNNNNQQRFNKNNPKKYYNNQNQNFQGGFNNQMGQQQMGGPQMNQMMSPQMMMGGGPQNQMMNQMGGGPQGNFQNQNQMQQMQQSNQQRNQEIFGYLSQGFEQILQGDQNALEQIKMALNSSSVNDYLALVQKIIESKSQDQQQQFQQYLYQVQAQIPEIQQYLMSQGNSNFYQMDQDSDQNNNSQQF